MNLFSKVMNRLYIIYATIKLCYFRLSQHNFSVFIIMDQQVYLFFTSTVHCFGRFFGRSFGLLGLRTLGLSVLRTIGPSDYWAFRLSGLWNIGPSDYRAFGLLDLRTIGPTPKKDFFSFFFRCRFRFRMTDEIFIRKKFYTHMKSSTIISN